ncbi:MAG: sugar kinase [Aeromicrobium sp.]|nr:sugar kinase [Burkholderiales bacterium]
MALLMARQVGPLHTVSDFARATAGAELNVAVGLSRLGFKVDYVSRLGKDSFGRNLLEFMVAEGIDVRYVSIDDTFTTGFMLKSLADDGSDPEIEYFRRGSAASRLSLADIGGVGFAGARWLHLTGISPALSQSCRELSFVMATRAIAEGVVVSFDPNLRRRLWSSGQEMKETINALAALADVVLPGLSEGKLLTGCDSAAGIADYYLSHGARQVIVKLGPKGAYYASTEGTGTVPAPTVTPLVDTVGAGDGFAVGVISAMLDGLSLREAAARGNAIGARVTQFRGDCEGLPNRTQLESTTLS